MGRGGDSVRIGVDGKFSTNAFCVLSSGVDLFCIDKLVCFVSCKVYLFSTDTLCFISCDVGCSIDTGAEIFSGEALSGDEALGKPALKKAENLGRSLIEARANYICLGSMQNAVS